MYCTHCGKELPPESKFCFHCGSAVTFTPENENAAPGVAGAYQEQTSAPPQTAAAPAPRARKKYFVSKDPFRRALYKTISGPAFLIMAIAFVVLAASSTFDIININTFANGSRVVINLMPLLTILFATLASVSLFKLRRASKTGRLSRSAFSGLSAFVSYRRVTAILLIIAGVLITIAASVLLVLTIVKKIDPTAIIDAIEKALINSGVNVSVIIADIENGAGFDTVGIGAIVIVFAAEIVLILAGIVILAYGVFYSLYCRKLKRFIRCLRASSLDGAKYVCNTGFITGATGFIGGMLALGLLSSSVFDLLGLLPTVANVTICVTLIIVLVRFKRNLAQIMSAVRSEAADNTAPECAVFGESAACAEDSFAGDTAADTAETVEESAPSTSDPE